MVFKGSAHLLFDLIITFFIIGLGSFGGGYAIIPVIEHEAVKHGWMTIEELTNIIGIAGMSPGPIATNSAILVGYSTSGILGAIISAIGMTLPSLLLVLIIYCFFLKFHQNDTVKASLYGIRPIVTSLIIFAAIKFARSNGVISTQLSWETLNLFVLCTLSLVALIKLRWHPAFVILLSGIAGSILFK